MTVFAIWVWLGGIWPAWQINRSFGRGRFRAAYEAIIWPFGLGRFLATACYLPDDE